MDMHDHPPRLSIVLPARNEAALIEETVATVERFLAATEPDYEVIVGDSGSTDGTGDRVRRLGRPRVRVVREELPGKGRILTRALREARGEVVGFLDADLEIPVTTLEPLLSAVRDGADAAIAVKAGGGDRDRPRARRVLTRSANAAISLLFGTGLPDHQAGCKLFRGAELRPVLAQVRSTAWLWDTEVLVHMIRRGARVDTAPCRVGVARPGRIQARAVLSAARDLAILWVRMTRIRTGRAPAALPTGEEARRGE